MYPELRLIHWGRGEYVSAICLHSPHAYYRINSRIDELLYTDFTLASTRQRSQDVCLASGGRILWELWNLLEEERAKYEAPAAFCSE